jgi:hypothetical protein
MKERTEVKGALLLNIVVRERPSILKLLARKNEALLIRRNAFLVLNLRLYIVDSVGRLDLEGNRLTRQTALCLVAEPPQSQLHVRLDKDLHTTTKTKHEMES